MNFSNKHSRILAIAPSARGFGYAVLEGQESFVDWGVKRVSGDKHSISLAKVEELVCHYQPNIIVLPDCSGKNLQRIARIQALTVGIISLAERHRITFASFSRNQVKQILLPGSTVTKHALAQALAERFPEELGAVLPPKRRAWMSEDSRMDIFDAVALALAIPKR
jgi:hypothetical protein